MVAQTNKKYKNNSIIFYDDKKFAIKDLLNLVNPLLNNNYLLRRSSSRKKFSKKEKDYINSYINDVILTLRAYHSVLDNYIKLNHLLFFILSCTTVAFAYTAANMAIFWLTSFLFNLGLGVSLRGFF